MCVVVAVFVVKQCVCIVDCVLCVLQSCPSLFLVLMLLFGVLYVLLVSSPVIVEFVWFVCARQSCYYLFCFFVS